MLLLENAPGKRLLRVAGPDRDALLEHHRAAVHALVHEMDRAAGLPLSRLERPTLGRESVKSRKE